MPPVNIGGGAGGGGGIGLSGGPRNYRLQRQMQEMKIHSWPATHERAILETKLVVHTVNTEYYTVTVARASQERK